jgi:diadenosine tetraphosphate (Ap4A) HIT family hydrolase
MSEFTRVTLPSPGRTVFENAWNQEDNPDMLFRSENLGIMALADLYPKLLPQIVVAPKDGKKGEVVHLHNLPPILRLRLHHVADTVAEKVQAYIDEQYTDDYVITHIEGRGVKDHAHIVVGAGEAKEGVALYVGASLGESAVQRTIELLRFNDEETAKLNHQLSRISVW